METIQKKICLLGDFRVGKTSLVRRFVEGRFDDKYLSTIGVTMSRKALQRAGHRLELFIWDLAGGESFNGISLNYLRGAAGALVVCDLTEVESLASLTHYAEQMRQINPEAALVFLGNKADLVEEQVLDLNDIQKASCGYSGRHLLTSAKTGAHVEQAFETLADLIGV